jgi:hypothetical protein
MIDFRVRTISTGRIVEILLLQLLIFSSCVIDKIPVDHGSNLIAMSKCAIKLL